MSAGGYVLEVLIVVLESDEGVFCASFSTLPTRYSWVAIALSVCVISLRASCAAFCKFGCTLVLQFNVKFAVVLSAFTSTLVSVFFVFVCS